MGLTRASIEWIGCWLPFFGALLFGYALRLVMRTFPISVYVAGSSRELSRVARAMQAVHDYAHHVTHDWTKAIIATRAQGIEEHECGFEQARAFAEADLKGVESADVVWMLVPECITEGFWVELGFALRAGKPIILSGSSIAACRKNIFMFCRGIYVVREDDVPAFITARKWETPREWW